MMQKIILGVVALCALVAGIYFAPPSQLSQQQAMVLDSQTRVFEPQRQIKPFTLTNQQGQTVDNAFFNAKWTLIFLGYTHCPDVCPTTLAQLSSSYNRLKAIGRDDLQVMFVSVDPQRDTSERLKEYTAYFHQAFTAASGPHASLYPFVRDLGLLYSMTEDTSQPEYAVNHSGGIVLVNPEGRLQAMFRPGFVPGGLPTLDMAALEADLQTLAGQR